MSLGVFDSPKDFGYSGYLSKAVRDGHFFPVFRGHAKRLGVAGIVLDHLLNCGKSNSGQDGYLMYTPAFATVGTGLGEEAVAAALAALRKKRIVEVEIRDGMRFVRVDVNKVRELD